MIPIRDVIPSKNYPIVNNCIIGINVVLYLVELSYGAHLDRFIYTYGLVPARYSIPHISSYFTTAQNIFSILSFMFLHGGFFHLLGNMWSLYIFGDNVEDRLGPFRYIAFYLLCGITSGLSHLIVNVHSNVPTIGASGAIAGVMGAYPPLSFSASGSFSSLSMRQAAVGEVLHGGLISADSSLALYF